MLTVVLGGFGFSTAWLIVFAWRLARARWPGGTGLQGPGTIRLWLGAIVVVISSSALEARIATHATHDAIGRASAAGLSALLGTPGSVTIFALLLIAALPWLFGARWLQCIACLKRTFGLGIGIGTRAALHDNRPEHATRRPGGSDGFGPNDTRGKRPSASRWPDARQVPKHLGVTRGFTGPSPNARAQPAGAPSNIHGCSQAPATVPPKPIGKRRALPPVDKVQSMTPGPCASTPPSPVSRVASRDGGEPHRGAALTCGSMESDSPIHGVFAPPPPVQSIVETLRAIEQQAAQWTALANPGLARQDDCGGNDASGRMSAIPDIAPTPASTPVVATEPAPSTVSPRIAAIVPTPPRASTPIGASAPALPTASSTLDIAAPPSDDAAATFSPPDTRQLPSAQQDRAPRAPAACEVNPLALDLLASSPEVVEPVSDTALAATGQLIEQRLKEFKVPVSVIGASAGPVITRFEIEPALGVRGSQIVGLMKDLSRGLGLTSIRVVETIPGKTCMGLELPNAKRQVIRLAAILASPQYRDSASQLTLALGKDITGEPIVTDLARAPHMLVAGTTGSGKSVAINAMILSLLYKATPQDVRLIMIDPKMLELSVYEGIPHLLAPVVTDMKLAANALTWCVAEMEKRYRLMSALGVRNLAGFNQKVRDAEQAGRKVGNPFSLTPDAPEPLSPLPTIVVVIDELADLMMVSGKKIEELIARLAQKARAAGIHLILATQRPSVDVITGLIKANIPTRVAFQVSSKVDSRTILDQMGAESLLGQGDMLFLPPGTGYPQRVHGAFVADDEVHRVVEYLKQFGEPEYEEDILAGVPGENSATDLFGESADAQADPLYDEAVAFVLRSRRASISSVQRQLRIGYNRAARLVEQMEAAGLVSSMGVNGSREVLAPAPAD